MNLVLSIWFVCLFSWKRLYTTIIPKSFDDLFSLLVREQFISSYDAGMAAFLHVKSVSSNSEVANLAERYMDAHGLMFIGLKKSSMKEKGILLSLRMCPGKLPVLHIKRMIHLS